MWFCVLNEDRRKTLHYSSIYFLWHQSIDKHELLLQYLQDTVLGAGIPEGIEYNLYSQSA